MSTSDLLYIVFNRRKITNAYNDLKIDETREMLFVSVRMDSTHQLELQDIIPPNDKCAYILFARITGGLVDGVF